MLSGIGTIRSRRTNVRNASGIVPGRSASALVEEPLAHFDDFVTEPGDSEAFGPDLAFVRIPSPSGFLATLIAKKSFCDLSGPGVTNRMVFITRTGPMASCGVVAEKTERSNGRITINQYVLLGTEPQLFELALTEEGQHAMFNVYPPGRFGKVFEILMEASIYWFYHTTNLFQDR